VPTKSCSNCGAVNQVDDVVCPNCGRRELTLAARMNLDSVALSGDRRTSRASVLWICALAVAGILVAVVLVFLLARIG
jgi:uncharacterized membrane protein YvbJ